MCMCVGWRERDINRERCYGNLKGGRNTEMQTMINERRERDAVKCFRILGRGREWSEGGHMR